MGFTKYQKTESAEVLSPDGHRAVERELKKLGKTSMRNLSPEQRKSVTATVDK